jgi:hypothetical protein
LTLVVVEVGGDGDDGLGDLLAELDLCNLFHLSYRLASRKTRVAKSCRTLPRTMAEIS